MTVKGYRATIAPRDYTFDDAAAVYGVPFNSRVGTALEYQNQLAALGARAVYWYNGETLDITAARHRAYTARDGDDVNKALEYEVLTDIIVNHDRYRDPSVALKERCHIQLNIPGVSDRIVTKTQMYLALVDIVATNAKYLGKLDAPKNRIVEARIPNVAHYLDLNKPLNQQSDYVKEKLVEAGISMDISSGQEFYNQLYKRDFAGPAIETRFENRDEATNLMLEKQGVHALMNPRRLEMAPTFENSGDVYLVRHHEFFTGADESIVDRKKATSEYLLNIGILGTKQESSSDTKRYMLFSEDLAETSRIITSDFDDGRMIPNTDISPKQAG